MTKTRIARKCVHAKLPFQSRINKPNSQGPSGSFSSRLGYPALVRVSVPAGVSEFCVSEVFDHFCILVLRPKGTRILARRVLKRGNNGRRVSNGQNCHFGSGTARNTSGDRIRRTDGKQRKTARNRRKQLNPCTLASRLIRPESCLSGRPDTKWPDVQLVSIEMTPR